MSLEKRELQRRANLRQQQFPGYMMGHHHAMWWDIDYPISLGDNRITSLVSVPIGRVLYLNPVALAYAVKAELHLTYSFAGPPDTFTITLSACSGSVVETFRTFVGHDGVVLDVSEWASKEVQTLCEAGVKLYVLVSNAVVPVTIHGAVLRFTMYKNDTFGGNNTPTDPLLILPSEADKIYIKKQEKLAKNFRYLSGLLME